MTSTTSARIERSGRAIRAALAVVPPAECAQFESEFTQAAEVAVGQFDDAPLQAVLDRWWTVATVRANPLTDHEQQQLARARAGDFTGFTERGPDCHWQRL